ncbi:MAG: hypothetical protein ACK5LJ_11370 [Paracoccus sp. (in: a-proteobacteria)]
MEVRNWDEERNFQEDMKFVGAGLASDEIAFYSDDPMRTPVGFSITSGSCSKAPLMPEIEKDHAFLVRNFDPLVRAFMEVNQCEDGNPGLYGDPSGVVGILSRDQRQRMHGRHFRCRLSPVLPDGSKGRA